MNKNNNCFPDSATVREIKNKPAAIRLTGDQYYIIEQGTIDTKLKPCNLTEDFKVNNLQVTVSGDVKETSRVGQSPCCIDNFVITEITK
jgi:hypothetical protein